MAEFFSHLLGKMVGDASEEWRNECECMSVIRMRGDKRADYLNKVENARGKPAGDRMRADMVKLNDIRLRS